MEFFMTDMQNLVGQTLGQYRITEQIGKGGMATIFKAYQPGLNRDVALKVLPPYVADKEGFNERFIREAQAIGNLHHPNILPVYDSGQDKGYGYIAMRYIPNATTLTNLMRERLSDDQIIRITRQIANALDHAHQAGVVHRDIKPSNILMDGNWVLLSDFGLAKMVESPSELTGTGVGLGTPAYMSPEQAKGEKIDHRTDIYALGIVLFEMLTGQVPHKAETPLATVVKRINEPLPLPRNLNPNISEPVERVLLKALATNPEDRFSSAGAFAAALQEAFEQGQTHISIDLAGHAAIPAPKPATSSPVRVHQSDNLPVARPASRSLSPLEIITITLLGIISACGVGGFFLSFTTNQQTGEMNIALAPACLGLAFAGVTSMVMLWIRNRNQSASALLAVGIGLWFVGINILGWGGFAALSPGDRTFVENFGFSLALCFAPGGILTLLGLGFYGYDYRRNKQMGAVAGSQSGSPVRANQEHADKLERAKEYGRHITNLIKQKKGASFAGQLAPISANLEQWQRHLQGLVNRLDDFENNRIIQRDRRDVPSAIARLQSQLANETNPHIRAQMTETLDGYKAHQRQLDSLVALMRQTELEIDETLAAIGAIYSQLQLLDVKDIDSSRAKRLSDNIDEQVNRLGDLLHAMDDVYDSASNFQLNA
jgi:serine/threonine-protein kinase